MRVNGRALYYVRKLANVPRPRVIAQALESRRGDRIDRLAEFLSEPHCEMLDQKWDIFPTLAQWRYGNGKNIQPIPKVFAKQSLLDVVVEISISGRDNSHINFYCARTAQ